MIDLEIQALSEKRDGLLIGVGQSVTAAGFTLQRQRLTQDVHGVLLTMVVRGNPRKQRALEAALEANERLISFEVSEHVEGSTKPHFAAAAAPVAYPITTPPIAPAPTPAAAPASTTKVVEAPIVAAKATVIEANIEPPSKQTVAPEPIVEPEPDFSFIAPTPKPPTPPPMLEAPFVEVIALEPDTAAVDKMVSTLATDYPQILPALNKLADTVAEGARESSLALAGQRTGAWLSKRDHGKEKQLALHDALDRIALPALNAWMQVERKGDQLHLINSPLCTQDSHSGCIFFSGYLEGLLTPSIGSGELTVFAVCCRSYGADACVLAISD